MKIINISDTHNKHKKIKWPFKLSEADLIIFNGDLTSLGQKHEYESFFNWFKRLPIQYKIIVAGNHDITLCPEKFPERPKWLIGILDDYLKYESIHFYLENNGCEIEGIKFWGSPISPSFNRNIWGFNKDRGNEINEIWKQIPQDTDVLITHGPPFGKLDYTLQDKLYVGCEDLLYHIKRVKPLLNLFGHIHEDYGWEYDENTTYINASICNLNYEPINEPFLIDLNKETKEVKILYPI